MRAASPLLWGAGVLALAWWPAARAAVPGLAALQGPLGIALGALSALLALGRACLLVVRTAGGSRARQLPSHVLPDGPGW